MLLRELNVYHQLFTQSFGKLFLTFLVDLPMYKSKSRSLLESIAKCSHLIFAFSPPVYISFFFPLFFVLNLFTFFISLILLFVFNSPLCNILYLIH